MKLTKKEVVSAASGPYLKLKDGESKVGVFRGEPYEYFILWANGKSQVVNRDQPGAKARFKLNFVVYNETIKGFEALVWEFGTMVYNQLAEINTEYPIETTKIKVTRNGVGTDTVYSLLPILKEPLGPKALKDLEAVKLNLLDVKKSSAPRVESDEEALPF